MIEHCIKYIPLNELRVGNKIYGADPTTVITVSVDTLILLERHPNLSMPIPITPDILIACGFKDMNKNVEVWDNGIQICRLPATMTFFFCIADGSTLSIINESEFRYLHQLQNLYFSLTGKEIEYNHK